MFFDGDFGVLSVGKLEVSCTPPVRKILEKTDWRGKGRQASKDTKLQKNCNSLYTMKAL